MATSVETLIKPWKPLAQRALMPSHWPTTGPAEIPPQMPLLRYPSASALRRTPASSLTQAAAPV